MYKHILIPTDGSKLAAKGMRTGVRLAKALGAKVTGVYVIPPYVLPMYSEGSTHYRAASPQQYKKSSEMQAKKALAAVAIEAETAGVPCSTRFLVAEPPWQGILQAARSGKCDAISMASHGRGGLSGLLLGSETTRVLANSKIPVLVTR